MKIEVGVISRKLARTTTTLSHDSSFSLSMPIQVQARCLHVLQRHREEETEDPAGFLDHEISPPSNLVIIKYYSTDAAFPATCEL